MTTRSTDGAGNPFEAMRVVNYDWQARDLARAFAIASADDGSELLGQVYACCRFAEFGNLESFLSGRFFAGFQDMQGELCAGGAQMLRELAQDFLISVDAWAATG